MQSADDFHLPLIEKIEEQHEAQFLELLAEQAPNKREKTYATLEKAVEMFEKGFEESFGNLDEFLAKAKNEDRS